MPTLRIALTAFFAARQRPLTGAAFMDAYAASDPARAARLDAPTTEVVRRDDVLRLLAELPLGRAVTGREVGDALADVILLPGPVLTDRAMGWIANAQGSTPRLVAALFALVITRATRWTDQDRHALEQRLQGTLEPLPQPWPVDYSSLVRVGRLMATAAGAAWVVATVLAEAALVLLPQPAWGAVEATLGGDSDEWAALTAAYRAAREALEQSSPHALERALLVGLCPRDGLVPLPASGRLEDVRTGAPHLAVAWPGTRAHASADPLVAAPAAVDARFLLRHVFLPGLQGAGIMIPWVEPAEPVRPLAEAVGDTPASGGWREVLAGVIARLGFERQIAAAGYTVQALLDVACGGPGDAPAASAVPTAGVSMRVAGATPATPAPLATGWRWGPAQAEIEAELRRRIVGHGGALRELAALCDGELSEASGPRILLLGPTGCGKSTLIQVLGDACRRPVVHVDAAQIVEPTWGGGIQLSDLALMAYSAAGGELLAAERALLCIDNLDAIRSARPRPFEGSGEADGADTDVRAAFTRLARQRSLLPLFDDGPAGRIVFVPHPGRAPLALRTRHLLVLGVGSDTDLDEALGPPGDIALCRLGYDPALTSRLTARVRLTALGTDELTTLLTTGPDGVVAAVAMCAARGLALTVAPEAVRVLALRTVAGQDGLTSRSAAAILTSVARRLVQATAAPGVYGGRAVLCGPDEVLAEIGSRQGPVHTRPQ